MILFYRVLLRLYPSSYRGEYGEEMCAIFAERLLQKSGPLAPVILLFEAIGDILPNALRSHADLLAQDLRYTARTLARSPGFAATAILVAALGVGATTATFSITDHVLVRPLPFTDSGRLVKLWQDESARGLSRDEVSPAIYRDWKRMSKSFDTMGAYQPNSVNMVGEGEPKRLTAAIVTATVFRTLGRQPLLGRLFGESDDHPGAPGTLLLSHRLWRDQFGSDPGILGRKVVLDDAPYEVVGVMPEDFHFPSRETEVWKPIRFGEQDFQDRDDTYLRVVARIKRGVSLEQARAEMRLITAQLARAYPQDHSHHDALVISLRDEVSPQARLLLKVLFLAAIGVLLIACTNLANLLLSRALARRKELAVRTAMGAGRDRIVRQLLTESLVIALCGGVLGVFIAIAATPLVVRLVPNALPIAQAPRMDLRVLAIAALLTAATGIGFGVVPALKACREADTNALSETSRTGASRRTERLRSALVLAEVTASVALLIASGLLIRALWKLQGVDPGFRAEGVLTLRTTLPLPKYEKTEKRVRLYRSVLSEIRRLPGVTNAAYISFLPMVARGGIWPVTPEGQPEERAQARKASLRYVTPGFFATLGIPIKAGRDVTDTDTLDSPFVAVVSESFVRQNWFGENPLGRRFQFALDKRTVVGVVGDIRVRGLEQSSEPQVYVPDQQVRDGNIIGYVPRDLAVRSSAPQTLLPTIRRIIAAADPQLPISDVQMLSDIVDADTVSRSVQVRVLGGFAAAAMILAGIGIHGLLAFAVSQRAREIAVRMALGAQSSEILAMVLRRSALLASAGVAIGAAMAYAAGRAMQALLVGVSPADAPTFAIAAALSFSMVMLGSLLPALRAVRVDPMTVIRAE